MNGASASSSVRLDTVRARPTPEGCELALAPAGPFGRALAAGIDLVTRLLVFGVTVQILAIFGTIGIGFVALAFFVLEWLAPVFFEVRWGGQTPGKRLVGLVVVHDDGTPVGWQASFIRNSLRFVDMLPIGYVAGFVSMLLSADGKRIGDLVAGTLVVHEPTVSGRSVADAEGADPPAVPLLAEERIAVIEFAERLDTLTDERALELAALPTPLVSGLTPEAARDRLRRIANYLTGQR